MKFIPYLNFEGRAEEALKFYQAALGGEISPIMRFGDMPNPQLPASTKDYVMHAELKAGDLLLYFSDSPGPLARGDQVSLMIQCDGEAQLDKLFAALSQGGKVDMAPQKMFWKAYYANFTDKFGIPWQLNYSFA